MLSALVGSLALLAAVWAWFALEPKTTSYNVLLISLDTTRRDHLSCYGYARQTTPEIDRLARDAMVFRNAHAVSNWTLPTHGSMFSGLYPSAHGARFVTQDLPHVNPEIPQGMLAESCETLAEVLQAAGYRTGAVVANAFYVTRMHRMDQGFDDFDSRVTRSLGNYRAADEITNRALHWLAKEPRQPFFLFLNYMDPHIPYNPPPPFDRKFATQDNVAVEPRDSAFFLEQQDAVNTTGRVWNDETHRMLVDRYDGEIAFADAQLGRVFDWLRQSGSYENTIIIVTADHGEAFGEQQVAGHGHLLYESEIAVPMIVKPRGGGPVGERNYRVSHVDILPTALELIDMPSPKGLSGRSMLESETRDLFVEKFASSLAKRDGQSRFGADQKAIYRGDLKYIANANGRFELYDLAKDPGELVDLSGRQADRVRILGEALAEWIESVEPLSQGRHVAIPVNAEDLKSLKELGYVQ